MTTFPSERFLIEGEDCYRVLRALTISIAYLADLPEDHASRREINFRALGKDLEGMRDLHRRLTNRMERRRHGKR